MKVLMAETAEFNCEKLLAWYLDDLTERQRRSLVQMMVMDAQEPDPSELRAAFADQMVKEPTFRNIVFSMAMITIMQLEAANQMKEQSCDT